MLNRLENKLNMDNDSLTVNQNDDGSFTVEWDKNDPTWKFLNDLKTEEIEVLIEKAIKYDKSRNSIE